MNNTRFIMATDRTTGQPLLINFDHVLAAVPIPTAPNMPPRTEILFNALDGNGATRQLAVTETPRELMQDLIRRENEAAYAVAHSAAQGIRRPTRKQIEEEAC